MQAPDKYKEEWKVAEPKDALLHGKWWEIFHDSQLNQLEEQVNVSNQNIAASLANYMQAKAIVREASAEYLPTVSVAPGVTEQKGQANTNSLLPVSSSKPVTVYEVPLTASWEPDLFGRIRQTVESKVASAQASAADLENERLLEQASLAVTYFQLRGQDALQKIYSESVAAYRESLELTKNLSKTGIDSDEAVAQAETQLKSAEAQASNLGIARAQYEHAIALLVGQPASNFSLPPLDWNTVPPQIPWGVPSTLLERRPDIAAQERSMAAANAQIGVATAAYFPTLTLNGSGGFASTALSALFSAPSFFWSVGGTLAETIFDGGARSATVDQYRAAYDVSVANYRQTVLTAFQQVEDNLASLRILAEEVNQQGSAVNAAQRTLRIATSRYQLGLDPYLNVLTAQTALLSNQQVAMTIMIQQMTASVQLIEALGGGWDVSKLPSRHQF
jgi:NodT family efflux transporter outer membrane factor (OMF) lipoprotein